MHKKRYVYVLVRADIPLANQLVQACHASLEAGFTFHAPPETAHMVLLSVKNVQQLMAYKEDLDEWGVRSEMFFEPDDDMGHTALATEPLPAESRKHFRKLKLWSGAHHV